MSALLRAEDIHTHYGESHILHGVNIEIRSGEAVGLLGRNGMGKSTLIRTMLGHVKATSGKVYVRGQDKTGVEPFKIARLGVAYVPEGRGVFPNLTVQENLMVAARPGYSQQMDWDYERVIETFPRLAERLSHGGQQLSGGEQQMLAIGRALMTNPDVLILDEATEGLAPIIVAEIWKVIATVSATGMAILIVDRNYKKVLAHTNRSVVLEKGLVVEANDSATLLANPELLTRYLGV
ncbi:ABC transporter ATP-binding protein [Paenalcaligenes hominis]|uniref:ABC transporter ATP-binding protein n=1 Tax=Paenalcaligenes hominis TaxID=643674 RepID=UPI003524DFE8